MESKISITNDHDHEIPTVHLPKELEESGRKRLSDEMREACEKYGCFMVRCDEEMISSRAREQFFAATKSLFDLPEETKQRHCCSEPYRSYAANCPVVPLSESFGIDCLALTAFTHLMWPQGNQHFSESVSHMGEKMKELCITILRMLLESLGVEKHCESHVRGTSSVLRLMKYRVGGGGDTAELGLVPHTDKSALTVICQNEVQGLEILTKQGSWTKVNVPESTFVVFVGDALKAWSNGRLLAARHRVMVKGERERYSSGLFLVPKQGFTIQVPHELVDTDHPLLYRPFTFSDYLSFFVSHLSDDALETYAAI